MNLTLFLPGDTSDSRNSNISNKCIAMFTHVQIFHAVSIFLGRITMIVYLLKAVTDLANMNVYEQK